MKVYLLNPPFVPFYSRSSRWAARGRGGALYYPIWLSYATGLLEKEGITVKLIDAPAWGWNVDDVRKDIYEFQPDIIVSESNFQSLSNDIQITKEINALIEGKSIIVGPPASQFPDRILNSGIDFVVPFEYDFSLCDLIKGIENDNDPSTINGISYQKERKNFHNQKRLLSRSTDLDELPFISQIYNKHLNCKDYFVNHAYFPMVQIITGRGCPNLCTFCSWPETLTGRKYRARNIQNVVDEFEYIANELPSIKEIVIEDDTFTVYKKRVIEFCNELKNRKIDIPWSCQSRAVLDYETIKKMKLAGCRLLDVGFESGNEAILANIKKGLKKEELKNFAYNVKKARIKLLADFVIGFPGETEATVRDTQQLINEIKPDLLQVAVATPIPGTDFYDFVKGNEYLTTDNLEESLDKEGFQKCIVSYPEFSKEQIESSASSLIKDYYLSPSYIPIAMKNIFARDGIHEIEILYKSFKIFMRYIQSKRFNESEKI